MENELRYYLTVCLAQIKGEAAPDYGLPAPTEPFVPSYIVTATVLPTDAIELAVNDKNIKEKVEYILEAYDDNMRLKTNTAVRMSNVLIV